MLYVGSSIHKIFIAWIGKHWTTDSLKLFPTCSSGSLNSLLPLMPFRCFGTTAILLTVTRNSLSSGFNTSGGHLVGERYPAPLPPLYFLVIQLFILHRAKHAKLKNTLVRKTLILKVCTVSMLAKTFDLKSIKQALFPSMTLKKAPKG